jgi:CheY-like chemotaxis protein
MKKRVLDVGNCGPDHGSIKRMLHSIGDIEVLQTNQTDDTLAFLDREQVDLILVNRKLDIDYSDGLEVIKAIKAEPQHASIPVMMVTNMEEYQQEAIQVGAEYGFGKLALTTPETHARIRSVLAIAN